MCAARKMIFEEDLFAIWITCSSALSPVGVPAWEQESFCTYDSVQGKLFNVICQLTRVNTSSEVMVYSHIEEKFRILGKIEMIMSLMKF